jgi:hypothetical protein
MVEYFEGMLLPQELPANANQTGQTAEYYGMINRFGANKTATSLSGVGRFSVMGEGQQQVLMMGVLNGTKVVATGTTDYWAAAAVAADQGDIHHQQETCQLVPGATAQDFMSKCLYSPADAASLDSFKAVLPTGSLDSTRYTRTQALPTFLLLPLGLIDGLAPACSRLTQIGPLPSDGRQCRIPCKTFRQSRSASEIPQPWSPCSILRGLGSRATPCASRVATRWGSQGRGGTGPRGTARLWLLQSSSQPHKGVHLR